MARKKEFADPATEVLAPDDLLRMLLSQARLGEAKAKLQLQAQAREHYQVAGELQALRLQAQIDRNLLTARASEQAARDVLAAANQEAKMLAEQMAERYAVDWKTASFDPLTGAIVRHPEDT